MKRLSLVVAVMMVSFFSVNQVSAQVNLNINISSQPVWGPVGYDHVEYYYFPDIDAYYYVPSGQYIYSNGGRWVWVNSLPSQFRNFDLFSTYKVVVNEPQPYLKNNIYVSKYKNYKNYSGRQPVIRDSRDTKYYVVKDHINYNGNNKQQIRGPQNNARPNRPQGNDVKSKQARPIQNQGRKQDNKNNNQPERNNGQQKGNNRH